MLIKSPKKILGVPIDNSATSYHRVVQPLYELSQRGSPWTENIQFLGEKESQPAQYEWADMLFIQCLYAPDAYKFYAEQKKKGKRIIIDFDDDCINIPEDFPEKTEIIDKDTGETYVFPAHMRSLYVQMFIQLADAVTVTNEHLKILYSPWNKNICVIPNCVSNDMRRDIPKGVNSKVRILWTGSTSHLADLEIIKKPLQIINEKYGDRVEFHFQGSLPFEQIFVGIPIVSHKAVGYGEYLNLIQAINPDICLAPLREDVFNISKSNLKFCQMTLMEAAFIATPYGPYANLDHEYDAMLARKESEWVSSISECIENENLRQKLVKNATKFVDSNHMVDKQLYRWEQLFVH